MKSTPFLEVYISKQTDTCNLFIVSTKRTFLDWQESIRFIFALFCIRWKNNPSKHLYWVRFANICEWKVNAQLQLNIFWLNKVRIRGKLSTYSKKPMRYHMRVSAAILLVKFECYRSYIKAFESKLKMSISEI